jgi:hypothetical protein
VAVVYHRSTKARFLPSNMPSEEIEVTHLTNSLEDGEYYVTYSDNAIGYLRQAGSATNNINNQILFAKLYVLCPILMVID